MSFTLTLARTAVKEHLVDHNNLTWSNNAIDEALRSALREISRICGQSLTLEGLDGAAATTLDPLDDQILVDGAVAYALTQRASRRFEEASPEKELPPDFAAYATARMQVFHSQLTILDLRVRAAAAQQRLEDLQKSTDTPYDQWEWDEGSLFK